jgi:hypothetical protein
VVKIWLFLNEFDFITFVAHTAYWAIPLTSGIVFPLSEHCKGSTVKQGQPDTCICFHSQIILAYAIKQSNQYLGESIMNQKNDLNSQASRCNCTALRKASRRISQLYDAVLAPSGLKTTQRAILAQIRRSEPYERSDHLTPRYWTAPLLSRNATDDPGSASCTCTLAPLSRPTWNCSPASTFAPTLTFKVSL